MQVTRWSRFGKDRLYVKDAAGQDLGWWDLQTDVAHPGTPETEPILREAVAAWHLAQSRAGPHEDRRPPEPNADRPDFLPPVPACPVPHPAVSACR